MNILILVVLFTMVFIGNAYAQTSEVGNLVRTIEAFKWSPPSPDSAGITYNALKNTFLIADSEVDEMPNYFQGVNIFELKSDGTLGNNFSTTAFSLEPTDITINPDTGHLFISDDNKREIFEIDAGADGLFGTTDDIRRSFSTTAFACEDPEGIAYGAGKLFIADGVGTKIHTISPGANGVFEGASSDDQITNFSTSAMRQSDPEGVAYNPDNNSLYIISNSGSSGVITETNLTGTVLRYIDISSLKARATAGVVYAPSSQNPSARSIYVVARGVDNDSDPTENDGKIYEVSLSAVLSPTIPATASPTLVPVCQTKSTGDADCIKNPPTSATNITNVDFEIWRSERFGPNGGCSAANSAGCGADEDSDGNVMDANFNFLGSGSIITDTVVNGIDFEIWRKGRFGS